MFNNLTGLGFAIISLGVIIVVGSVVLLRLGESQITCDTGFTANASNLCTNSTDVGTSYDAYGVNATAGYIETQMGQTGLAGWIPAIVALVIGVLFLGAFLGRGRKY